jgi:beta-glucosidase
MKLIERSAQIAAQEASADGINWTFSPMDVSRDHVGKSLKVL